MHISNPVRSIFIPCFLIALLSLACAFPAFAYAAGSTSSTSSSSQAASVKEGWQKSGNSWKYVYSDSTFAKGFKKIDSKTYYFNDKGIMKTGWQKVSGSWYYFDRSGAMKTGWQKLSGKWYYLASNGKMLAGKRTISGKTYYFADSGVMKAGWQKISNAWYYFKSDGAMKTGWQKLSGKWYYLNSAGKMLTGWQKISNKWYFFNGSGVMQASKWIGNYWLQSSGAMATNAWVDGGRYYVDASGKYVKSAKQAALDANPTVIRGNGTTSLSQRTFTGVVKRGFFYGEKNTKGYVTYLQLPKKLTANNVEYHYVVKNNISDDKIVLDDSCNSYLGKTVTVSGKLGVGFSRSPAGACSSFWFEHARVARVF